MNVLIALVVAVVFGAGVRLMLGRNLLELAAGVLLGSNAAVLLLVSAGFGGRAGTASPAGPAQDADPLVQALAITAIVIGFGTAVLLLRLAVAVERTHETLDTEDLVAAEVSEGSDRAGDRTGRSGPEDPDERERRP